MEPRALTSDGSIASDRRSAAIPFASWPTAINVAPSSRRARAEPGRSSIARLKLVKARSFSSSMDM